MLVDVSAVLPVAKALAVVPPTKVIVPAPIEGEVVPVATFPSGVGELKFHSVMMVCALAEVRETRARAAVRMEVLR